MSDVDEIIDYIKSLKRGFDKDLFESKIDELAHAVDTDGLEYEAFHTLFKIWLNLSIPITKWVSIGVCLVPQDSVTERSVVYALRWLLATNHDQTNFSRIGFLLDWLTAAMDCDSIDITALDCGYEVFFSFLTYEVLAAHVLKLVYTLTKPADVTRARVLELFDYARKRESKKSMCRQLQVLLGLFKSYKPEFVPEDIPAVPVHTTFRSNITLLTRFKRWQEHRNTTVKESHHLMWTNPMLGGRNKKSESLVPSIEFINMGSQQYADKEPQKNCLDFTDPVSLLQYSVHRSVSRPARLRALLRNTAGVVLLALSDAHAQAALHHDIHYMLTGCFLVASPHSYADRRDGLQCIAGLQRKLCQPLGAVTAFLAYYLPLWDETQHFGEILELLEWVDAENPDLVLQILEPMTQIYHRAQPVEQCAILRALTTMYANLVYSTTRSHQHFVTPESPRGISPELLQYVATTISDMCGKGLQVQPDDLRVLYSSIQSAERMGRAELTARIRPSALAAPVALALPLLSVSGGLLDRVAGLILLYKKIIVASQSNKENRKDQTYLEHKRTLKGYTCDVFRCLVDEIPLSGRQNGFVFSHLSAQLTQKLTECVPGADSTLSIRNHLAFAPFTYLEVNAVDFSSIGNEEWFEAVINKEFTQLSMLLTKLGFGGKMVT